MAMMPERQISFGKPLIGEAEIAAVVAVLQGTQLVHGPRAKQFEADFVSFAGGGFATSVGSCTAALHLCYFDMGLGAGDEVIVPSQSHVATAHAVELTGARPVFVDCEPDTGNLDPTQLDDAITDRTRAISLVHYLGLPAKMDAINAIASKRGLAVIEDCALAVGSYYKGRHCGLLGDAGCFSFYPVKHFTTGEGGMILSRDAALIERMNRKKAFGVDRTVAERTVPGVYDVTMLGFNYRMNELGAALGIVQLTRIAGFLEARARNAAVLRQELQDITEIDLLCAGDADHVHSHYCLSIVLKDHLAAKRFEVIRSLNAAGVGTSIYYPMAIPELQYYREKYATSASSFVNAKRISDQSIAMPVAPHLGEADMIYIGKALKAAIRDARS